MKQNLRKKSREFKVLNFPMLFIYLCCGIQPHHKNGKPHETHTKPQYNYRNTAEVSDWAVRRNPQG